MAINCATVGELIQALQRFAPETSVEASWEGIWRDIAVYRHKHDGACVIDADGCMYEKDFSDGSPDFEMPTGVKP